MTGRVTTGKHWRVVFFFFLLWASVKLDLLVLFSHIILRIIATLQHLTTNSIFLAIEQMKRRQHSLAFTEKCRTTGRRHDWSQRSTISLKSLKQHLLTTIGQKDSELLFSLDTLDEMWGVWKVKHDGHRSEMGSMCFWERIVFAQLFSWSHRKVLMELHTLDGGSVDEPLLGLGNHHHHHHSLPDYLLEYNV